jgi:histidine ammonia-lyase
VLEIEINSVTDNPLIFENDILSGGNFHGEPVALILDFLAIAVSELGSISERRSDLLLRSPEGADLPLFLVKNGGLNSGFMIPQYVAAALVNENKVLSHPASVDSIPTSANKEDHVSMGATAANKLRKIIDNVYRILSIEFLISLQAIDFHKPLQSSPVLERIRAFLRNKVAFMENDRYIKPDVDKIEELIQSDEFFKLLPDLK